VILPNTLRRPCANQPYEASLTVSNGTAPYRWQVASADWTVAVAPTSTDHATLSTAHIGSGTTNLTVQVTDADGAGKTANFSLIARDACWFAYTTVDGASGPKLKLLDPLTEPPTPHPFAHNDGVYDFQFSPNGQFLAYSFGRDATHPTGRHLALITLATLHEQVVDVLEDSLVAYSWSPDSKMIAVGFIKDETTYLTAVQVPAPGSNTAPVELAPKPAFVESKLYWIGTSFIAFHAQRLPDLAHPGQWLPNPYQLRTPFYARLGDTGFDAPQAIVEQPYDPHVYAQANSNGFFMIGDNTYFNPLSPSVEFPVPLWMTNVISPSGKYAAELDDGQVQIFDARQTLDGNAIATSSEGQECPSLLAWARDRERFACVADLANPSSGTHGEVRIFDLSAAGDHLEMTTLQGACTESPAACATQNSKYVYSEGLASEQARALSPSGRWLAFATASSGTDNYLYWADLNEVPYRLKGKAYHFTQATTVNSPTEISFSPDESSVLLRRGRQLNRWRLSNPSESLQVANDMVVGQKCSDDFMSGPDQWCGNTERSPMFHWSPDSAAASFRTASEIRVYEFSNNASHPLPALACEEQCDGQFTFQPLLQP